MTVVWGPWSSNDRLRAGIEFSMNPSTVGPDTASVQITCKLWMQTRYASYETGTNITPWTMSGSMNYSGYANGWNLGAMGTKVLASRTTTFNTSYSGPVGVTVTTGYTSTYAYPGTHPTVTGSINVPQRPYDVPAAPSDVTEARDSDSQATVSWTNNATAGAPYSSLTVQMQTYTGSDWSAWETVANPSGSATSYVKSGLSANHLYDFQVRANNGAGSSAFVEAPGDVYMTPGAPSGVSSSVDPGGASVTTTWTNTAYISATVTHQIERSVNGGAWTSVQTGIAQGTTTWVDGSPGAGSNKYRVASKTSQGDLVSAYTEGNTVSTIVAPLAPTQLSPNGIAVDLSQNSTWSWQHNHGGDGAAQTHFSIRVSDDNGASWTTIANDVASSTQSYNVTANTLNNGTTYLWQVQTEGVVSGGYGPWSASATVVGSKAPAVTLQSGYPPDNLTSLPLEVRWTYNQDQNSPQASWGVSLRLASDNSLLQYLSGTGTTTSATFSYPLANAGTYKVEVQVVSGAGLTSNLASKTFTFNLLPPAEAHVTPTFDECTGTMVLHLTADDPVPGVTVSVQSVIIERRVFGGAWVTLATGIEVPNDLLDMLPLTNGLNEYRVTAVSSSPSYFVGDVVQAYGTDGSSGSGLWCFLAYGDGFAQVLRFHGAPAITPSSARVRAAQGFLGRSHPVLLVGENTTMKVAVAGSLHYDETCPALDSCTYDSPPADWIEAGLLAEMVCYRDYTGRRMFAMLGEVSATDGLWPGHASVSFDVTEVDYTEVYGDVVSNEGFEPWCDPPDYIDGGTPASTETMDVDGGSP